MHSSKIRPTLLPERGRRETATIPPTANPIPHAGERAGKKQLSMQSDIQITNRNDTCFVDIEGVIGVPEEWQFDQPSSRVATYEKFRDSLDRLREIDAPEIVVNIRSTGGDVNDALLIYEALSSLDGHIVTRCYGYTASAATVIAQAASEGCREISAHALYLIHNSICTAEGNAEELATRIDLLRKTDARLAEVYAARKLLALLSAPADRGRETAKLIDRIQAEENIVYAPLQRQAVELAAQEGVVLLTGGPGTGKTTSVRCIVEMFRRMGMDVVLAAPTGRAAKRMSELCGGVEAQTIHRLLGFSWNEQTGEVTFTKTEK